MDQIGLEYLT